MNDGSNLLIGMQKAMRLLGDRQRVIAGNLANSDTPGFKALDLKADFAKLVDADLNQVSSPSVRPTNRMAELGMKSGSGTGLSAGVAIDTGSTDIKPNGNSVNIEEQMIKMSQVQSDYISLINLYRKHISLFKAAVGK
jgi:flagellar basal-body rod protein FlgB